MNVATGRSAGGTRGIGTDLLGFRPFPFFSTGRDRRQGAVSLRVNRRRVENKVASFMSFSFLDYRAGRPCLSQHGYAHLYPTEFDDNWMNFDLNRSCLWGEASRV